MDFLILILTIIGILFIVAYLIKIITVIALCIWYLYDDFIGYISDKRRTKKRHSRKLEKNKEKAAEIIDRFEDLLAINDIKIPNENREGNDDEACIYGDDYYNLEESIMEILSRKKGLCYEMFKRK